MDEPKRTDEPLTQAERIERAREDARRKRAELGLEALPEEPPWQGRRVRKRRR